MLKLAKMMQEISLLILISQIFFFFLHFKQIPMQKQCIRLSNTCRDRLMKEDRGFLLGKIQIYISMYLLIYVCHVWVNWNFVWKAEMKTCWEDGLKMKERCRQRRFCDWFREMWNLGIIAVWGKWMVQRYSVSPHRQSPSSPPPFPPPSAAGT